MSGSGTASVSSVVRMKEGGVYNDNSQYQKAVSLPVLSRVSMAISSAKLDWSRLARSGPIVIADYGSSQGRNSLAPIKEFIGAIGEACGSVVGCQPSFLVVHEDTARNDWCTLFEEVKNSPQSYMNANGQQAPDISFMGVGRSFYERVTPRGFVHVAYMANSVHWLSTLPCQLTDHISANFTSPQVQALFVAQSNRDWQSFLQHRGEEIRSGGILVVSQLTNPDCPAKHPLEAVYYAMCKLVEECVLTQQEVEKSTMPFYPRLYKDLMNPSIIQQAGFQIIQAEEIVIDNYVDRMWPDLVNTNQGAVAHILTAGTLAVCDVVIRRALDGTDQIKQAKIDQIVKITKQIIVDDFQSFRGYVATSALLILRKI